MTLATESRRWRVAPPNPEFRETLARELDVSPVTAQVLINRGYTGGEAARAALRANLNDLAEPLLLPDLDAAAKRLVRAVTDREQVTICGDYDADGLAAVAVLRGVLSLAGLPCRVHIPHRLEDGYGLNLEAVERLAREGTRLAVTVDSGVSALAEAERLAERGVDLVITDHHEPGETLPRALAVVNPKRTDVDYPFRELAGAGVAFKLAWGLAQKLSPGKRASEEMREYLREALALVAIGTVADVVPLVGENRVLVRAGLGVLRSTRHAGLRALVRSARLDGRRISAEDVAFRLAPRLNAASRLGRTEVALALLEARDANKAEDLAGKLDALNRERQRIDGAVTRAAQKAARVALEASDCAALVLAGEWHQGVIGISAGRLAKEFGRPVALVSFENGIGRGSARSVGGFSLHEALSSCADALEAFGGHRNAAGFTVTHEHFEAFRERFVALAAEATDDGPAESVVEIDAEAPFALLAPALAEELALLAPFGHGNPAPVLATFGLRLAGRPRTMGARGEHLAFHVSDDGASGRAIRCVAFRGARFAPITRSDVHVDLAYEPILNGFAGRERLELRVREMRPSP